MLFVVLYRFFCGDESIYFINLIQNLCNNKMLLGFVGTDQSFFFVKSSRVTNFPSFMTVSDIY